MDRGSVAGAALDALARHRHLFRATGRAGGWPGPAGHASDDDGRPAAGWHCSVRGTDTGRGGGGGGRGSLMALYQRRPRAHGDRGKLVGVHGDAVMRKKLKCPWPYFGGKSAIASVVWDRL